jgi:hypothetical protein
MMNHQPRRRVRALPLDLNVLDLLRASISLLIPQMSICRELAIANTATMQGAEKYIFRRREDMNACCLLP